METGENRIYQAVKLRKVFTSLYFLLVVYTIFFYMF